MISRPQTTMPPTTDPASLVRRAKTSQIQNSFQNQRLPGPGLLGPPTAQPTLSTALPPRMPPISTGQSDGLITPMPGSWNQQPPTHQPPHPAGPQPFAYSAFQNALRESGRGFTPGAGSGGGNPNGFTEPPLPVSEPPGGPHDELGLDPGGANYPGGNPDPIGWSESDPPPDGTQDPPNLYEPPFGGGESPYDPASGIGNSPPPTGNDFPTFGGGPWVPSQGGVVGTGTTDPRPWYNQRSEPWYGRVARSVIPYGIGQLTHLAARAAMANRGRVGASAHVAGGSRGPNASAPSYASGTPGSPGYQSAGQHFDYARGRVVNDRDPGRGFAGSPNQGAEQQAMSPRAVGMNVGGDAGRSVNTTGAWQNRHVDPATAAALRAWSANHTTVRQVYGGG